MNILSEEMELSLRQAFWSVSDKTLVQRIQEALSLPTSDGVAVAISISKREAQVTFSPDAAMALGAKIRIAPDEIKTGVSFAIKF